MNICIPIDEDKGLQSPVCAHFGSAPAFMILDLDSGACRAILNGNQNHDHGTCSPLAALQGERIDGMVVGGIGMGALNRLMSANIRVYLSEHRTVEETARAFKSGTLKQMQPNMACAHHGQGHQH
jgi:predicted Fe-Mo cluster-binding NifX family protein